MSRDGSKDKVRDERGRSSNQQEKSSNEKFSDEKRKDYVVDTLKPPRRPNGGNGNGNGGRC